MNGCFAEATALATTLDSIIIILKTGVSNCRDEKIKESRNKKITRPAKDVVVTKHPQRTCLCKVVSHCDSPFGWLERARKDPMVPEELRKWKCGWASSLARWASGRLPPTLWSNSSSTNKQQQPTASSSYKIHFMHQSFLFFREAVKNLHFSFLWFFL